jgi:hypothetical protein
MKSLLVLLGFMFGMSLVFAVLAFEYDRCTQRGGTFERRPLIFHCSITEGAP